MRIILALLLTAVHVSTVAQTLSLTQAFNEPKAGDIDNVYKLDTSLFSEGVPVHGGYNAIWDFSRLKTGSAATNQYLSATSNSFNYPGNIIIQVNASGFYDVHLRSVAGSSAQTEIVGISTSSVSLTFTNPAIIARYPMGYNTTFTDQIAGTVSGLMTGSCKGAISTSADGYGTLKLPYGYELDNVLRVKSVQTITLSAGFLPLGTMRQTLYSYYHASGKFPVLSINYQRVSFTAGTPSVHVAVLGNAGFLAPVGISEENPADEPAIFPNPAAEQLTIRSDQTTEYEVQVFNTEGKSVLTATTSGTLIVDALPPGVYLVEARDGARVHRRKFIKS